MRRPDPARIAPHGATVLAVLACAGAAAYAARAPVRPVPAAAVAASAPQMPALDVAALAARHLFGAPPAAAVASSEPLPLALTLAGVLHAHDPARARALLAGPDGTQRPYATGDALPGGARLVAIGGHGVRVAAAGREQELALPEVGVRDAVVQRPPAPTAAAARARALAARRGQLAPGNAHQARRVP